MKTARAFWVASMFLVLSLACAYKADVVAHHVPIEHEMLIAWFAVASFAFGIAGFIMLIIWLAKLEDNDRRY